MVGTINNSSSLSVIGACPTMGQMSKYVSLSLKVSKDVKERFVALAKDKERSQNWLATKYIIEGMNRDEKLGSSGNHKSKP